MSALGFVLALIGLLFLSAVFSGSETGVYSLSVPRVEAEARQGRFSARLMELLLSRKAALLVTLLVGNNLVMELATYLTERRVHGIEGLPSWAREIAVTVGLTPLLFLFGEVMSKDLFRRRPYQLLTFTAPLIWTTRLLTLPITLPLYALSKALERSFGLRRADVDRALRREEMLQLLAEGARSGNLAAPTEELARNVLVLRRTRVREISVPWERVTTIDLELGAGELAARILDSSHSRLPAVRSEEGGGIRVVGYLHQLDYLGAQDLESLDEPARKEFLGASLLRPIPAFDPSLPVHQALAQLRTAGQRLALVGSPEEPEGLVTLMDLVSVIAGQAAFRPLSATANQG